MITDVDVKKLKESFKDTFVTKDDLKNELKNHPTHTQLNQSIRQEFNALLPEWTRVITESVTKTLSEKIDKMYVKLDKFVGDIQDKRMVQELHDHDHVKINSRLDVLEKKSSRIVSA